MIAQQPKKNGFCKVTEVTKDASLAANKTKITIKFIGPNAKPVKSNVKFIYNNDSLFPVINEQGKYSITLVPGKYKMKFAVPYWHEVSSDSISCNKQTYMSITVKFEAKDF
jgi:hypothetical protein